MELKDSELCRAESNKFFPQRRKGHREKCIQLGVPITIGSAFVGFSSQASPLAYNTKLADALLHFRYFCAS